MSSIPNSVCPFLFLFYSFVFLFTFDFFFPFSLSQLLFTHVFCSLKNGTVYTLKDTSGFKYFILSILWKSRWKLLKRGCGLVSQTQCSLGYLFCSDLIAVMLSLDCCFWVRWCCPTVKKHTKTPKVTSLEGMLRKVLFYISAISNNYVPNRFNCAQIKTLKLGAPWLGQGKCNVLVGYLLPINTFSVCACKFIDILNVPYHEKRQKTLSVLTWCFLALPAQLESPIAA